MKRSIICIFFFVVSTIAYSYTVVDQQEPNGTHIRTISFGPGDKEYDSLKAMKMKYDSQNILISRILILSDAFSKEKDMVSQEEIYNPKGIVERFIITFTDEYFNRSGILKQIETVDANDNITDVEYHSSDGFLFKEKYQNRSNRFPFYKISYLSKIMFDDFVDDPKITDYGISMKYVSATSIIKFLNKPIKLDDKDKDFLNLYSKSRKADNMIPLYNKKVLVQEDDKNYYIMIQDSLLQYVISDEKAAISYYFGTRDNDFMIICTGFTDIPKKP